MNHTDSCSCAECKACKSCSRHDRPLPEDTRKNERVKYTGYASARITIESLAASPGLRPPLGFVSGIEKSQALRGNEMDTMEDKEDLLCGRQRERPIFSFSKKKNLSSSSWKREWKDGSWVLAKMRKVLTRMVNFLHLVWSRPKMWTCFFMFSRLLLHCFSYGKKGADRLWTKRADRFTTDWFVSLLRKGAILVRLYLQWPNTTHKSVECIWNGSNAVIPFLSVVQLISQVQLGVPGPNMHAWK